MIPQDFSQNEPEVTKHPERLLTKTYYVLSAIVVAALLFFGA